MVARPSRSRSMPKPAASRSINFVIAHDCGAVINPMVVDGQIIGAVAHGIGNALYEWMGFDENCQPVTTNLGEYLLITAPEVPVIEVSHHESPTYLNRSASKASANVAWCRLPPPSCRPSKTRCANSTSASPKPRSPPAKSSPRSKPAGRPRRRHHPIRHARTWCPTKGRPYGRPSHPRLPKIVTLGLDLLRK